VAEGEQPRDATRLPFTTLGPPGRSRQTLVAICIGVVLVNIAMVGASAVGTLVAADALGPGLSALPNAAGVLGTGVGALVLTSIMARRGRRDGLLVAYGVAVVGAIAASTAILGARLALLIGGMLLLGVGNAAAQLSRYAAAEAFPLERRGLVLGAVVWGGTVGAVVGPNLIAPLASFASSSGLPPMIGPYVLAFAAMLGAGVAILFMPRGRRPTGSAQSGPGLRAALQSQPRIAVPLVAMVAANFTMVAVMTMTPVYVHLHGESLSVIGTILSAHMIGMFVLSPLSGRLADWRGGMTAIWFGVSTLICATVLAATAPVADSAWLSLAVFLLGYGWNLCWVGGSSLLAGSLQLRLQGDIDALVWTTSAMASLISGGLLAIGGFYLLVSVGAAVALTPVLPLLVLRRRLSTAAA
jgi:MFS family permease